MHRAIRGGLFRAALALLALCLAFAPAFGAGTTLQWDPNTEPDLAGYKLHYGLASRSYSTHIDVGKVVTRTVTGLADGTTYYLAVSAYDSVGNESTYSNEVVVTTASGANESVSTPQAPSGPTSGAAGVAYTYTASGAAATSGDPVQYRFSWADGSDSGWLAAGVTSASKTWSAAGTYTLVRVQARCATHTSVVSQASPTLSVTIAAASTETVTAPTAPSGPTAGVVGAAYTYTTGGSVSSAGDAVEYRFLWSDGTASAWLPAGSASAVKTWNAPASYTLVRAEARCSRHTSIVSPASASITVVIAGGVSETVSAPSVPAGPASATAGTSSAFTTGGAASSSGDPVRYRFDWGDGTVSEWLDAAGQVTASKSWSVPGTYLVRAEAACVNHPTVTASSASAEVTIGAAPVAAHVLWSRSDTGQAALWELDPSTNAVLKTTWLPSKTGVGASWQARAYTQIDATTGYVLWSRSDTGRAVLWKVDSETGAIISSAFVASRTGVGAPWLASGYTHVDDTTGYVLWTRSDTGRAVLWKVDPSVPDVIPPISSANLYSSTGIGAGWQATSYTHVNDTTGYVLWTRSDLGKGVLWRVDPSQKGTIGVGAMSTLFSPKGVGAPWQATSFTHVDDTTGYVLWTRSDTGRAVLWKVDPSATGTIPIVSLSNVSAPSGIGSRWQATAYAR